MVVLPKLAFVVPCYNDEDVIDETTAALTEKLNSLIKSRLVSKSSFIILIDDGSKDSTWKLIEDNHRKNVFVAGIKLAKNCGEDKAFLSGLLEARNIADVVISLDSDLQDDISIVNNMLADYKEGSEIVYGVRSNRDSDTFLKRSTANLYYHILKLLGADIVFNHAQFRLMSKKALFALLEYREFNLYLRGIIPMLGYKTTIEYYSRKKRFAGKSHYSFLKLFALAINGITSLTARPLHFISVLGFIVFFISLIMIVYTVIDHFTGNVVIGWPSIICSIWAIGGLVLLSIGVAGEYIGKIYMEVKHRPRFNIERFIIHKKGMGAGLRPRRGIASAHE
jgi:glycosyltransferase involved in cell wall biosynthesis